MESEYEVYKNYDSSKTLINCGDDSDNYIKIYYHYNENEKNYKVFEVYHSSGGGDCSEYFFIYEDAKHEFLKRLYHTIEYKNEKHKYDDIELNNIFYSLITTEKKYLNKKLLEDAYEYDIVFVKSKKINDYVNNKSGTNIFKDYIYVLNIDKYLELKDKYSFIDYNFLDNQSKGEKICSDIMKELYPLYNFIKVRPDWLKNKETGHNLELDLYCQNLNIAIEYNGKQHYDYCEHFHKNIESLNKQIIRDNMKKELCQKNNVKLIIVSYKLEKKEDIKQYIQNELNALNNSTN